MASYNNSTERTFRLQNKNSKPYSQYNKIKVGKSTLDGNIAYLNTTSSKNRFARMPQLTREKIEEAITLEDTKTLRQVSEVFYRTSGIYKRLCKYMAYLYKYDWFIVPRRLSKNVKDEKVIEGWVKACTYLDNCGLKKLFGEIALEVIKKGSYYGYLMKNSNAAYLQKLPADYCRTRYTVNGQYAVEFNIKYFDECFTDAQYRLKVLKLHPKEFQKAYIAYKQGNLVRDFQGDENGWFLLDPDLTVRFRLSDSDAPLFVSVIPAILDLEDAKELDKDKMALQLLKIIIQKLPMDKNGDPVFDMEEGQILHDSAVDMVGDNKGVKVLTTLADASVADLSDKSNTTSIDWIDRAYNTVYSEGGVSQMQFNTSGNLSLEKSIANDEASLSDLILQFEDFVEKKLLVDFNKNPKKLYFSYKILPTTIYNYKDLSKTYKEQTTLGFSKLLPQVALGFSQLDVLATALFENGMMNLNDVFTPPQMSSTTSGKKAATSGSESSSNKSDESNSEGGRPELPDSEKSEKTIQNLESQS